MAFTFGEDLTDDNDYVRFHCSDTISPGFMSDALITSLVATSSSVNAAAIKGLRHIIGLLARPDFKADWLTVTNAEARKGYESLLKLKLAEFGASQYTSSVTHVYRADSDLAEEPTYD